MNSYLINVVINEDTAPRHNLVAKYADHSINNITIMCLTIYILLLHVYSNNNVCIYRKRRVLHPTPCFTGTNQRSLLLLWSCKKCRYTISVCVYVYEYVYIYKRRRKKTFWFIICCSVNSHLSEQTN